jgi:hypothetical protein
MGVQRERSEDHERRATVAAPKIDEGVVGPASAACGFVGCGAG